MLKILLLLFVIVWPGILRAQTINTTAGSVTSCPGEIVVPIDVTNCNGIGAISLALGYNNTVLTYMGYESLNPALSTGFILVNSTASHIMFSWANTTPANVGDGTLMNLRFAAVPGTGSLTWDTQTPGNCEFADINGNVLPAAFVNGMVTINRPPEITVQPTDQTVLVSQNSGFSLTAIGTNLAYLWQISTDGGASWSDLSNNAVYSGVTTPSLGITNALLTFNGYQYHCRITGTCTPVVYSNNVTLSVILPVTTILPIQNDCPGDIVVPVTVTSFAGVAAFSLTFSYDASILAYSGFQALNGALAGGTFVANASGGKVYLSWSSTVPAGFGDGTIVEVLFTAATGTSPFTWDTFVAGNCEYSDLNGDPIATIFVNGSQSVYALPEVVTQPPNRLIAKGQNTSFPITAIGSGLSYQWQVSIDGGSVWSDLVNGGYYSGVTSSSLNITNAQLELSGYLYRCRVSGTCMPMAYSNQAMLTVLPNIITTCPATTWCPGEIVIPLTVNDFIGVAAFSMVLSYNPAILTFTGTRNLNSALAPGSFVANASGGKIYLIWSNNTASTLANGSVLLELVFAGIPGSGTLNWDTQTAGNCEYSDISGQIIFSTWMNGNITINQPPLITADPADKTMYAGGSTSFTIAATGTGIAFQWQVSSNGGSSWSNLVNGSPYTGVSNTTLTINPVNPAMDGNLYRSYVTGTCTPTAYSASAELTVTQAAITTTATSVANSCSGTLNIPVTVTNCLNVGSISLALVFDTTKLSFLGYNSVHAELSQGFIVVNRSGNKVLMSWASTDPADIGSGTLIQYRFNAKTGSSTSLTWDTHTAGNCEYTDISGSVITSLYTNATITYAGNPLIVSAGADKTITPGGSVQLEGSATGGVTSYTYLWSPTAWLSNPAIADPVATPLSTTEYTLMVTGANGCSGSDIVNIIVSGGIPVTRILQNVNIPGGEVNCYDATQSITVAGSSTYFTVQNGGSATLIAGQQIFFLPGTTVFQGGYLHGYITTTSQYCGTKAATITENQHTTDETAVDNDASAWFKLYPNPTDGPVTLEMREKDSPQQINVTVFSLHGELVFKRDFSGVKKQEILLSDKPVGLYFVRVISADHNQTMILLKK